VTPTLARDSSSLPPAPGQPRLDGEPGSGTRRKDAEPPASQLDHA